MRARLSGMLMLGPKKYYKCPNPGCPRLFTETNSTKRPICNGCLEDERIAKNEDIFLMAEILGTRIMTCVMCEEPFEQIKKGPRRKTCGYDCAVEYNRARTAKLRAMTGGEAEYLRAYRKRKSSFSLQTSEAV